MTEQRGSSTELKKNCAMKCLGLKQTITFCMTGVEFIKHFPDVAVFLHQQVFDNNLKAWRCTVFP